MADDFSTPASSAVTPLVAALDVGSTGTRGCLFDARGLPVEGTKVKVEHAFTAKADGTSTIDPDQVVKEIGECLDHVCKNSPGVVDGVAIDTFASSLVGVDKDNQAMTPCFTYADSRPAAQVNYLRSMIDEDATQQRTGTRQHTGYLPARFLWLQQTDPKTFGKVHHWMSLGEYVWQQLIGDTVAGTSTAAWTGMLDRRKGTWDKTLCELVGVDPDLFSPIANPDQPLSADSPATKRWKPLAKAKWFPPITDGYASSIGVGGKDSSQVVLATATSGALRVLVNGEVPNLPRGLWCNKIDADRSILGGALNDVGRAFAWLEENLKLPEPAERDELLRADPEPGTPLVLPWFTGERSTGWMGSARAVFQGVSAATGAADLYRGTVEGVALSYQRVLAQMVQVIGRPTEILASGRVQQETPALLVVLADVLEVPITPVPIKRSTLHGTALMALDVLAPTADRTPPTRGATVEPDEGRRNHYRRRAENFQTLYDKLVAPI